MPTAALRCRANAAPRGRGVSASACGSSNLWRVRRHQPWRAPHGPVRRSTARRTSRTAANPTKARCGVRAVKRMSLKRTESPPARRIRIPASNPASANESSVLSRRVRDTGRVYSAAPSPHRKRRSAILAHAPPPGAARPDFARSITLLLSWLAASRCSSGRSGGPFFVRARGAPHPCRESRCPQPHRASRLRHLTGTPTRGSHRARPRRPRPPNRCHGGRPRPERSAHGFQSRLAALPRAPRAPTPHRMRERRS